MENRPVKTSTLRRVFTASLCILSLASSCGVPGGTLTTNDVVPSSATLLYQGSFIGSNGVSGTAQVYSSFGTVLLHLEGLVTPIGTSYVVFLENGSPSSPFYLSPLKGNFGNQNYSTGRTAFGTFSRVALRVTSATHSTEVAAATLIAVGP